VEEILEGVERGCTSKGCYSSTKRGLAGALDRKASLAVQNPMDNSSLIPARPGA
jgi:hypothetical protein